MTCFQCEPKDCIAPEKWVCKESGNFYTTGEYHNTVKSYDIHGVSFNQKVDSVKQLLDNDTIQILKVLLTDNEHPFDYTTGLEIIYALQIIQSRLSTDNKICNKSYHSRGDGQ